MYADEALPLDEKRLPLCTLVFSSTDKHPGGLYARLRREMNARYPYFRQGSLRLAPGPGDPIGRGPGQLD